MKKWIHEKEYENIFCCGDLHGNFNKFIDTLNKINFNYNTDLIICTGDLIDRGNQSLECLQLLKEPWFKSVLGNHEQFIIDYIETLDPLLKHDVQLQHMFNGGNWFYLLTEYEQNLYYRLIKDHMPLVYQLDTLNVAILHAEYPHLINDWNYIDQAINNFNFSFLWGRKRIKQNINIPIKNINKIYVGHTIVENEFNLANITYIDSGFYYTNNLIIKQLK